MSVSKKKFHAEKRGNRPQEQDKKNLYIEWRDAVQKRGNCRCAILQIRPKTLHCHHIFSKKIFSSIQFDPENGILLASHIHEAFHEKCGYLNIITMDHFLDFLNLLMEDNTYRTEVFKKVKPKLKSSNSQELISNQATLCVAGSETITSSEKEILDNLLMLYKNMEELREVLFQKLNEKEKKIALDAFQKPISARSFEYKENDS